MAKDAKRDEKKITPRDQDYSQWYHDIILRAALAEHAPVKGCMVIRPHGYAIWELIQKHLDAEFKRTGHQNACLSQPNSSGMNEDTFVDPVHDRLEKK